jgi:hypothetical protein
MRPDAAVTVDATVPHPAQEPTMDTETMLAQLTAIAAAHQHALECLARGEPLHAVGALVDAREALERVRDALRTPAPR